MSEVGALRQVGCSVYEFSLRCGEDKGVLITGERLGVLAVIVGFVGWMQSLSAAG